MSESNQLGRYLLTLQELARLQGCEVAQLAERFTAEELVSLPGNRRALSFEAVRRYLQQQGHTYRSLVVAHVNLRGGVGKTTSSISLATRAVEYGYRTCLLDLDPQASASLAFNAEAGEGQPIFYDIWPQPAQIEAALVQIDPQLWLLPSSLDNTLLDSALQRPADQKQAVGALCRQLQQLGFDLIVIDAPPALNTAVISTICAVDLLVIPLAADSFSFRGVELTLQEVRSICDAFGVTLPKIQTLLVRYDGREVLNRQALERLQRDYRDYQLPVHIRTSTRLGRVLERRETIFAESRKDPARDDYDAYTRELLSIQLSAFEGALE
ncbi:ParA family protein [Ectothiorhodospiraceae bacterium BW-2]|nr:ParA family protein [Ectothiorhodospiraceae bacterium BW-2]